MMHVISFDTTDKANSDFAFSIRYKVFVEEQNVSHDLELDEFENESIHYLVFNNNEPIGASRWRKTDKGIKLERFAVLKPLRNAGAGRALLHAMLHDIEPLNAAIYLHAQISAEGFYLKNNFVSVGNHFWEAGIEHVVMYYKPVKL